MRSNPVLVERAPGGTARVVLNRPELRNAFDDVLVARLREVLAAIGGDPRVRVVLLAARGSSFSAGADLAWMRRMANADAEAGRADALALAETLRLLAELPRPTVALVNGPARGGGVGLVAACDLAVAAEDATFALGEVRLGLVPATIAPHVVAAIGPRAAGRYALTGEAFDAAEALRLGLVHEVVPRADLDAAGIRIADALARGGPAALAETKALLARVAGSPLDDRLVADTAERIARVRASPEGREGVEAFLERRPPGWVAED
jgi:methylglutaconyl-CoA hydratase